MFVEKAFYLFGGMITSTVYPNQVARTKTIGRMDLTGQWTRAGYLKNRRIGHTAVYDGEYFMIIGGGAGFAPTEKCLIESHSVSCVSQSPKLESYMGPEAFLIAESFCEI